MADTSNNIKINVEIVDNIIKAEKKVVQYKSTIQALEKSLIKLQERQEKSASAKGADKIKAVEQQLIQVKANLAAANIEAEAHRQNLTNASLAQEVLEKSSENAAKSLSQLKAELQILNSMSFEGLNSEEIKEVENAIILLNNAISQGEERLKNFGSVQFLNGFTEKLQAASAGVNVLSETFTLLGGNSDIITQIQNTLSGLISTVQSLTTVTEFLEKSKQKATVASGKMTIAQKGLNLAMKAMPIFAIISAISILSKGIAGIISLFKRKSQVTRDAEVALKEYEATAKETSGKIADINDEEKAKIEETTLAHRNKILEMKKNGATAAEIAAEELKQQHELADTSIQASEDRTKATEDELKSLGEAIKKQTALQQEEQKKAEEKHNVLIALDEEEKRWYESKVGYEERLQKLREETYKKSNEAKTQLDELIAKQKELNKTLGEESRLREDVALKTAEMAQVQEEQAKADREAASKKYLDIAVKEIEEQRKLNQELIKANEDYLSEDFETRQRYARQQFELDDKAAQDTLNLRRKYGNISQKDYDRQIEILNAKRTQFENEQLAAQDSNAKAQLQKQLELQKKILKSLDQEFELQRIEVKENSENLISEIEAQMKKLPEDSEQYKKLALDIIAIKEKLVKDLEVIDKNQQSTQNQEYLEKFIADSNQIAETELEIFGRTQQEKYRIEKERLEAIRNEKIRLGMNTADEDAALLANELANEQAKTATLLANESLSAKQRYEIKRKGLEKELASLKEGTEAHKATQQKIADLDQTFQDQRLERVMEFAEKSKEIMGGIFEFTNALDEAKLQKATEQNEQEKQQLQAQLDANLISKDEYNKKVKQSDDNLAKEQAKIKRKQAIQEKVSAIFDVSISTTTSIAKSAQMGFPAAIPFVAMAAAMGALQLATVMAQPLPKAAKGMYIKGNSHYNGGVQIEAEGGEMVINKRSSSMFAPLLSAINEAGGGVPFVSSYSDGGFALRDYQRSSTQNITSETIANAVKEAVQEVKIYTAIEDINEGSRKYSEVTGINQF